MIKLTDLIRALSVDEVKTSMLSALESLGFPIASWAKGAVIRTIVAAFSATLAPFTTIQVEVAKSGFLDWAEGDWLSLLAEQVYSVTRNSAEFAVGAVTLDNAGGGLFTFAVGAARFYNPTTGKVYRNTEAFTLDPLETGLEVAIEAIEIGSASTSEAGAIDSCETTMLGVTISNASVVVGYDEETDADLRDRCRLSIAAVSPNGPADAYDYVAKSSELNGGVTVTRTNGVFDSDLGLLTLYIAGPAGAIGGPDVALVQDAIDRLCVPTGFDCTLVSATAVPVAVTATLFFYTSAGADLVEAETKAEDAITAYLQTVRVGGELFLPTVGMLSRLNIAAAIRAAVPEAFGVTIAAPATDLTVLNEDEVVTAGTLTITCTQVDG